MSGTSIFILIICILICLYITLYIIGFILYSIKKHHTKLQHFVYHDIFKYHLPDHRTIHELPADNSVQFTARCRCCGKEIFMKRKGRKKWHLVESLDDVIKEKE